MKRVALTLAVLAVVALTTGTAWAGPPSHSVHVGTTLVKHHGHRGPSYRYHSPHRSMYRSRSHVGVYVHPPVVVYPSVYPSYRYYPSYPSYRYYHSPHGGIQYYGKGFGFSIGF